MTAGVIPLCRRKTGLRRHDHRWVAVAGTTIAKVEIIATSADYHPVLVPEWAAEKLDQRRGTDHEEVGRHALDQNQKLAVEQRKNQQQQRRQRGTGQHHGNQITIGKRFAAKLANARHVDEIGEPRRKGPDEQLDFAGGQQGHQPCVDGFHDP